jgi:hypothetical protein
MRDDRGTHAKVGRAMTITGHARRPFLLTLAAWAFMLTGAGGILKDVLPLATGGRAALDGLLGEGDAMLAFI